MPIARSYCCPRQTISASFSRRPCVRTFGAAAAATMSMVATMKTTISSVYPACLRRRVVGVTDVIELTRWTGFLQSQRGAAPRRNLFHIGGRIREANDAEPPHEGVPFARNDDVLVVGRRKERPPVVPAKIADVAEVFGVNRQWRRTRRRSRSDIHRLFGRRRRRGRRQRRAENAAVDAFVFKRQEAFQNIQPQRRIIHVERRKSRIQRNRRRSDFGGGIPRPVKIERRAGKHRQQHCRER